MENNFNFNNLRKLDVTEHIKRKGKFNYLSWAYAVDILLQQDQMATWDFKDPMTFADDSMMVFSSVTAFGKTMPMHLAVMDMTNKAVKNPSADQINKAMMRCLTKNIACFGVGLHIYEGDDLPSDAVESIDEIDVTQILNVWLGRIKSSKNLEELKAAYVMAYEDIKRDKNAIEMLAKAKDEKKAQLNG